MNIGDKLRALRKDKKLTLKEVSMITGLSISFISDIENKRRKPSIDTVKIFSIKLNIPMSDLLDEEISFKSNNSSGSVDEEIKTLDEDVEILVKKIQNLSKDNRKKALKMLDIFLNENI